MELFGLQCSARIVQKEVGGFDQVILLMGVYISTKIVGLEG